MDDIQKKIEELEDEQCAELLVKQVEARVTYQCLHILDHCNTLEEAKKKGIGPILWVVLLHECWST